MQRALLSPVLKRRQTMVEFVMKILIVYAHPDPKSFCHALLQQFVIGLQDAGHTSEVVDLYAMDSIPFSRAEILPTGFPMKTRRMSSKSW